MDSPTLVLFKASSGAQSALLRWPSGRSQLLHSAVAPETEALDVVTPEIWGDVILCLGTGLGYHLMPLLQIQRPLTIVLCETFAPLLDATTQRFVGSCHRVLPVLCPNSIPPIFPGAKIQVIRHPASYRLAASLLDTCAGIVLRGSYVMEERNEPKAKHPRTLLLYGRHFLQEELVHAMGELGVTWASLSYENSSSPGDWESSLMKILQEFRPDLILSVNMKGIDSDGILMDACRRLGIAVHVWFVDDPRPIVLAHSNKLYPWIQAWCWERAYLPWLKTKGFCTPRWLPLAGDAQLFKRATSAPVGSPLDLVFTGSAMGREFLDRIRRSFLWDDALGSLVDLRSELLLRGWQDPETLLDGLPLPFQDERNRTWLMCLIQHTASHKRRVRTLGSCLSLGLVCAGDPHGWREALGDSTPVLKDLDYRKELGAHYQRCAVNLNLTSCQMPTAVNQRVFDVPLCGGFLLTDNQSDLGELFAPDDVATYNSPEELREKIGWFLAHPGERQRIAERSRTNIISRHTYAQRLGELFRFFQNSQASL